MPKQARDLYGSFLEPTLAFIIGPGPSISKAEKYLMEPHPHVIRIALNAAIRKIPAEYFFFIDLVAYQNYGSHPNARAAKRVGVENFADQYDEDTYAWERAMKLPGDVQKGKLLHRGTSVIPAIGFAAWLGCPRIVLVGCDNQYTDEEIEAKRQEVYPDKSFAWCKGVHNYTTARVNVALNEMPFWLPDWVMVRDASHGTLNLKATGINFELEKIDQYWTKRATQEAEVHGSTQPA